MSVILRNTASGSSSKIYRWNDLILRSPIIKRILPDQKKIVQFGDPRTVAPSGELTGGYRGSGTDSYTVTNVGYLMLNYMVNGQPTWVNASSAHDPELVWYQGAYSTSASAISQGKFMCEAYGSFPGFHFTIPNMSSPFVLQEIKVYYLNMGATLAYGPAIDGNVNNKNIKTAVGDWNQPLDINFRVLNTPTCNYHPMYIISNFPADTIDISTTAGRGDFKGYRDLFMLAPMGVTDGCIPTLTNPLRQSYTMSATTKAQLTQNGGGWIVPTYNVSITSSTNYRPKVVENQTGTDNYWGCFSLRDVYIDLVYDVA